MSFYEVSQIFHNIKNSKHCVEEFWFDIDDSNNKLLYTNNKYNTQSLIVNVSANSIKQIFKEYGENCGPLYNGNLRYYITNKSIDNSISKTMESDSMNFWYFNNGIVSICEDFEFSNDHPDKILVKNITFVNGGQTSYLIGTKEFKNNFYVPIKFVNTKNMNEKDRPQFILDIATATNKQKPIKPQDLLTNSIILIDMKNNFKNYIKEGGIYLKIKRGQKIPENISNLAKKEKWLIADFTQIGQLGLAIILMMPGSAKSAKTLMFTPNYQKIIFNKEYCKFYNNAWKLWYKIYNARNNYIHKISTQPYKEDLLKVSRVSQWFIFNFLIFLYLIKIDNVLIEKIKDDSINWINWQEYFSNYVQKKIIDESFFKLKKDIKDEDIYNIVIIIIKQMSKSFKYLNNPIEFSNFVKTNENFRKIISKSISEILEENDDADDLPDKYLIYLNSIFD